jgi:hypothetical protein
VLGRSSGAAAGSGCRLVGAGRCGSKQGLLLLLITPEAGLATQLYALAAQLGFMGVVHGHEHRSMIFTAAAGWARIRSNTVQVLARALSNVCGVRKQAVYKQANASLRVCSLQAARLADLCRVSGLCSSVSGDQGAAGAVVKGLSSFASFQHTYLWRCSASPAVHAMGLSSLPRSRAARGNSGGGSCQQGPPRVLSASPKPANSQSSTPAPLP